MRRQYLHRMIDLNKIYTGQVLDYLRSLPDNCVNTCVTSPPYWNLRDYGIEGQLGMEKTPEEFVENMTLVFTEVFRVLREDGTLWLNIGDSYATKAIDSIGVKARDLVGIPWILAFAFRRAGWYLRCDIIWHKPNPMPESCQNRPTKAHEYLFLFSKSKKYYYDAFAIKTSLSEKTFTTFGCSVVGAGDGSGLIASENWSSTIKERKPKVWKTPDGWDTGAGGHGSVHRNGREKGQPADKQRGHSRRHAGFNDRWDNMSKKEQQELGANKRSVWSVATQPFKEAHFATFPEELIVDCIKAGSPVDGVVLDPFMGAGTTALVARKLGRNFLGCELNPKYVGIANKRLKKELGLFQ